MSGYFDYFNPLKYYDFSSVGLRFKTLVPLKILGFRAKLCRDVQIALHIGRYARRLFCYFGVF